MTHRESLTGVLEQGLMGLVRWRLYPVFAKRSAANGTASTRGSPDLHPGLWLEIEAGGAAPPISAIQHRGGFSPAPRAGTWPGGGGGGAPGLLSPALAPYLPPP